MILWKIALRNIFRHRSRSLITLSAIVFGCVAIIFVGGFFDQMFLSMREGYINANTGHLQIFRRGFGRNGRKEPFKFMIDDPSGLSAAIRQVPGVKNVQPLLIFSGLLSTGDTTLSFLGQGVDPETQKYMFLKDFMRKLRRTSQGVMKEHGEKNIVFLKDGEGLTEKDTFSALLGKGLADSLDAKVGDSLVIVANSAHGYINAIEIRIKGIILTPIKAVDDVFLQLPLRTAQDLLQTTSVQTLVVRLDKTEKTDMAAHQLMEDLPRKGYNVELKTWMELNDFYVKTVVLFTQFFRVVKAIIAIIVILSIFNTMNMAVLERTNEIGTLMALGTKPGEILKLFLCEGFFLGFLGGLIGLAVGGLVTAFVSAVGISMPPPPGSSEGWLSKPTLVPSAFLFAYGLSVVTALLSSAFPAFRASRLEAAAALRKVG